MKQVSNLSNQLLNAVDKINASLEFNNNGHSQEQQQKLREAVVLIQSASTTAKQAADMVGAIRV